MTRAPAHDVPVGLDGVEVECVASDAGPMWFPVFDKVMRPYIRRNGTWEPEEGVLLRRLLRPGGRFVDVGANVGYFSRYIARHVPDVRIDAFEPHPLLLRLLRLNLWQERVAATVWPLAAGTGTGLASLETSPTNPGDTRSAMSALEGLRTTLLAPATSVDEALDRGPVDVVKIDVQGSEPDVVAGMRETIRHSPGISLVLEFWPGALRESNRDPLQVLADYRRLGLRVVTSIGPRLNELPDREILDICDSGGPNGSVNLLLVPRS